MKPAPPKVLWYHCQNPECNNFVPSFHMDEENKFCLSMSKDCRAKYLKQEKNRNGNRFRGF